MFTCLVTELRSPPVPNDPVDHPLEEHIPMHYSYYSMCLPSCFTAVYLTVMLEEFKRKTLHQEFAVGFPRNTYSGCQTTVVEYLIIKVRKQQWGMWHLRQYAEVLKWESQMNRATTYMSKRFQLLNIFYCWGIRFVTAASSYIYDRNKLGNMQR